MGMLRRPHSFRMQVMLLSVSISTVILLGFGGWAWHMLRGLTGLDRLDGEMKALGRTQLSVPQRDGEWVAFEEVLDYLAQLDPPRDIVFAVLDRDGQLRYQSAYWPSTLAVEELMDRELLSFMPPPEAGRGPTFRGRDRSPGDGRRGPMGPGFRPGMEEGGRGEELRGFRRPPPGVPVSEIGLKTYRGGDGQWRVAMLASPRDFLIVAADLVPYYAEVNALRRTLLLVLILALLCIGAGGWVLSHQVLRPVDTLIAAAESITAQDLEHRLPEGGVVVEFARLNGVFNHMLERLDRSFKQATRFSADAAHELKTPLTILQGQLNQLLQEAPDGSPLQQRLSLLLEEVQRLTVIIRRLLLLSLADAGRIKVHLAPVRLDSFLETVLEDVEVLAPELALKATLAPDVVVHADAALLRQAVQNLVNNAIKYNIPDGKIRVALFLHEGQARITVANTSHGIPEGERKRVFHRFYRADPAHSRDVDGVGLGLSLAREIVRSQKGKLWLADAPEGWVMFVIELPLAPPAVV